MTIETMNAGETSVPVENGGIWTNAELRASAGSAGDAGMSLETVNQLRQAEYGLGGL
jgi:hypothetical protein